jgi:8-oxo-dGTP pyrophosphatase MutT (NUDIX family)
VRAGGDEVSVRPSPAEVRAAIADALRERVAKQADYPGFRQAAILLPLYLNEGGPHLLLTKRTELVPTHKGQISFPGGGFEGADGDLLTTALREAREEIGLRPEDVEIVGTLDDTVTVSSRHVVRPFVGFVPHPYPYRLDPFEIERLIHLPISALLSGAPFREETWEREGRSVTVFLYDHEGDTIWGLTARVLKQFIETVGGTLRERGLLRCEAPSEGGGA